MNRKIQQKIEDYKKIAASHKTKSKYAQLIIPRKDSLLTVIRSKKEADQFMHELDCAFKIQRDEK